MAAVQFAAHTGYLTRIVEPRLFVLVGSPGVPNTQQREDLASGLEVTNQAGMLKNLPHPFVEKDQQGRLRPHEA